MYIKANSDQYCIFMCLNTDARFLRYFFLSSFFFLFLTHVTSLNEMLVIKLTVTSFYSCFTFVIFYTFVCRKIALVANVICLWKPTLNKVSCILYLVSCIINTLNSGRVNPSPAVCIRSFNHIPQSKSMHIMPRGHIENDPSTSS